MKSIILLLSILALTISADDGDWVDPTRLPLQEIQVKPFFAGYLNLTDTKKFYYVYNPSQSNPTKDPLLVHISSKPGCSVLHEVFYNGGEFVFVRNSSSFRHNEKYNWNKIANVLYIEGPGGVGFSLGEDANHTDESLTEDYYGAILKFYEKFPQLKDQKMYLMGKGYGGIIIPKIALYIINLLKDLDTPSWQKINYGGMMLTNPCVKPDDCQSTFPYNQDAVQALRNFFFLSAEEFQEYRTACTLRTSDCQAVEKKIQSNFLITGADNQNVFSKCLHQTGGYGCIDHLGIDIFLNKPEVQEDLNAQVGTYWNLCNFQMVEQYTRHPDGSLKILQEIIRNNGLKIWIISGTQSVIVPTLSTKTWYNELKMNVGMPTIRFWQPWFYDNINVGQTEMFPGLTFLTIRSAGTNIFGDQPQIAHHALTKFIKGQDL